MDLGLDRLGLAHDSGRWILLLGSLPTEIGSLFDLAIVDVNSGGVIPGTFLMNAISC